MLISALQRIKSITDEVVRLGGVTNSGAAIVQVSAASIDATKLDYQLAALLAGKSTSASRTGFALGGWAAYAGRQQAAGNAITNFYDIYGANSPSAVSNSQYHYGTETPIFIEDQPLARGSIVLDAAVASLSNAEAKFLVSDFSQNDFGDTHSLVLLVDSLSVQHMLATLDPGVTARTLNDLLLSATNTKGTSTLGTQGKAEGDVLELTLDSVRRLLLGPLIQRTAAKMEGGTWALIADRNVFHDTLNALTTGDAFKALVGKVRVGVSDTDLRSKARNDFSALASLITLSPVVLTGLDSVLESKLQAAWSGTYADWLRDKNMSQADRIAGAETFTDRYFADRAALLNAVVLQNQRNTDTQHVLDSTVPVDRSYEFNYYGGPPRPGEVLPTLLTLIAESRPNQGKPPQFIAFGDDADTRVDGTPYQLGDHLYGGAGNDFVNGLAGADYLEGNAGNDTLNGGDGNDTLLGGSGIDTLYGGANDDTLLGGADADLLYGEAGQDTLRGGAGDDHLDGGTENDHLVGGDGADTLVGGAGNDQLNGDADADSYIFNSGWGTDTIEDSDGLGSIVVTGLGIINGAGAKKIPGGTDVWQTFDKKINYTLVAQSTGRNDLYISFSDRTDVITVRNWGLGQLGIVLDQAPAATPPPPTPTPAVPPTRTRIACSAVPAPT